MLYFALFLANFELHFSTFQASFAPYFFSIVKDGLCAVCLPFGSYFFQAFFVTNFLLFFAFLANFELHFSPYQANFEMHFSTYQVNFAPYFFNSRGCLLRNLLAVLSFIFATIQLHLFLRFY